MKIVFFGSGAFGIPSLQAVKDAGYDLAHTFTQPAHPAGRGRKKTQTPVALWAAQNNIQCTESENINSPEMIQKVASCVADLLIVIAFGQKISDEVIKLHQKGAINVHASLLPKYRGAAPINWALINNDSHTGVSIITLADKMDAGFILGQSKIEIEPQDDAQTLHDKLTLAAPLILIETIGQIAASKAVYTKQDESLVTYAHKLKKSDGFLEFSQPAEVIRNKIRGLWPWPGAQADYVSSKTSKCVRVTIAKTEVTTKSDTENQTFGLFDRNLNVICGQNALKIVKIKPAGSALMDFKDFVNGRKTIPGDVLLNIQDKK
jgi:methionyl-tRNA formyltransferase